MSQEEIIEVTPSEDISANEDTLEKNIKTEKTKKLLVILLIMILFGGTYYYYRNIAGNNGKNEPQQIAATGIPVSGKKVENKDLKTNNTEKQTNQVNIDNPVNGAIKPTDKTMIAKQALAMAGKNDPFSGTGQGYRPSYSPSYTPKGTGGMSILPPPPSIGGLPGVGDLPKINIGQNPYQDENQETLTVKGFVGNKVIVNVNGVTESLKVNESFQGVRVLNIDPKGLVAKFRKNGEIITKRVRDLNNFENNSDLKLVKNLNKQD